MRNTIRSIKWAITRKYAWLRYKSDGIGKSNIDDSLFKELNNLYNNNKEVSYRVSYGKNIESYKKHKWVGIQDGGIDLYTIPNDEDFILSVYDEKKHFINHNNELFKWTGGCIYNNTLFAFPRKENSLLAMSLLDCRCYCQKLSINYANEHHYAGVCTNNGIVYQPPRNTDHILKINLNDFSVKKIYLTNRFFKARFRYCGSIVHPNGYIYMFPENKDKVIVLDSETDKISFIDIPISTMVFDAKVALDKNIYGFSAYGTGILKIDVLNNTVKMIHKNTYFGAYGTKMGADGWLYSVPGDGDSIWRYNVEKDICECFFSIGDSSRAKFAGGITTQEGSIVFCPATSNKIISLIPNEKVNIPESVYSSFFKDNY